MDLRLARFAGNFVCSSALLESAHVLGARVLLEASFRSSYEAAVSTHSTRRGRICDRSDRAAPIGLGILRIVRADANVRDSTGSELKHFHRDARITFLKGGLDYKQGFIPDVPEAIGSSLLVFDLAPLEVGLEVGIVIAQSGEALPRVSHPGSLKGSGTE